MGARQDSQSSGKPASIKGLALQSVVQDLERLRREGRLDRATLERISKPEDRELLDELPMPTLWYPIDAYARLLELLWEIEGGRAEAYLIDRGARAAERILAAGIYASMLATAERWGGDHVGRAVLNLSTGLYDFTTWKLEGRSSDESFRIVLSDAARFPDVARLTAQGFLQVLFARSSDEPVRVTSRRFGHDEIVMEVRRG